MFSRRDRAEVVTTRGDEARVATTARGGVSGWSILTGVLVAFGVLFLLSAIAGAIIVNTGLEEDVAAGDTVEVGVGAGIAIVLATFVAYLWGGYTAGRMARGNGFANGLLVPIVALVIAAVVSGLAYALGQTANLGLPFAENRLPLNDDALIDFGVGVGIATLVAMLLGGLIGGLLGARWHTKLEQRAVADGEARSIDLQDEHTATRSHPAPDAGDGTTLDHRDPIHTRPAGESTRSPGG